MYIPHGSPRLYGHGLFGNRPENPEFCIVSVSDGWYRAPNYGQCSRKRGHGPNGEFCRQHAKKIEDGRLQLPPKYKIRKTRKDRRHARQ